MAGRISRMISLSRDNIMQFSKQEDFFAAVPAIENLREQFNTCNNDFDQSAKEQGCRCRANTNLLLPCMTAFIEALNTSKAGDQELMKQFICFVAKTPEIESTGVTIYHTPSSNEAPQRYSYP